LKIIYDRQGDVLRILLTNAPIERTDARCPGVLLDFDQDGELVGMEVQQASRRMQSPSEIDFVETDSLSLAESNLRAA
jgi:uncharacterized protein YuzE